MVSNNIEPTLEGPRMFNEAWNHPNKDSCRKWRDNICKEFANMNKQKVWQKTIKYLTPLFADASKINGSSKLSAAVCTEHVL